MKSPAGTPTPVEPVHTRAAKGGLVSGASFALNLGLNLIQVPLLLRFWSQEMYGHWLSVAAFAGILTSLDGGHQAYVGNLLNRYYVEDRTVFQRTLASAVRVALLTSSVQILAVLLLCLSGQAARWLGIGSLHAAEFSLAVVIYTVGWISTGSVGAILVRLFLPTGYFVRSMWWGTVARIVQFLAVALSAWLGWGLVGTSLMFTGMVFVANLLLLFDIYRLYPGLFPWWRDGDFGQGFRNFTRSNVLTGVSLLDMFSLQGVVLLVTGTLGAAVVPLFTTLRTLSNTAMQGTGFLLNPIQADLVRYHVRREGEKLVAVFSFFWLLSGTLINGGFVAGLYVVEPVYAYWTRGKLAFDRTLFCWLAAAILVRTLAAPMQSYLAAINHLKALAFSAALRAALTVGGVLLLAPVHRLGGVGLALFVAELAGSLLLPGWFASRSVKRLGSRPDPYAPALAACSTILAGGALLGFGLKTVFWPWLAAGTLALLLVLTAIQWRKLPSAVRERVFMVIQPMRLACRSIFNPA